MNFVSVEDQTNLRELIIESILECMKQRDQNELNPFIDKEEAAVLLKCQPDTIRHWRRQFWQEGVHYFKPSSGHYLYNRELIINWVINRQDPDVHLLAVMDWQKKHQPKTKRKLKAV